MNAAKRSHSSDTSHELSSPEVCTQRKAELLRRARKIRKNQHEKDVTNETPSVTLSESTCVEIVTVTEATMAEGETGNRDIFTGLSVEESLPIILKKLCTIEKDMSVVRELQGQVFELQKENAKLRKDLDDSVKKQTVLEQQVQEARFLAETAYKNANDAEQYGRRNNIRVYGVPEPEGETSLQCELKVVKLINEKLQIPINRGDIEAAHRLGQKKAPGPGEKAKIRPIIVRFLNRKATEDILGHRKNLKGSGVSVAEDLTHANFVLLNTCMDDVRAEDAWSRRGSIYVKSKADGMVKKIEKVADLNTLPMVNSTSTPINPRERRRRKAIARHQGVSMDHAPSSNQQMSASFRDVVIGSASSFGGGFGARPSASSHDTLQKQID